uniref:TFIIS N-terminal domain-containing protein n=1 Tax=Eutreptiella gymnastica TaxID=73025 RepID=A0A7S1NN29_9EUGL|mmetsp:Transcript_61531/g.109692  ORF Transcript_61531/g.109692 Transcript_61531/m.109692 type:complete len:540 (+) Transcript_61531:40-1659(+)
MPAPPPPWIRCQRCFRIVQDSELTPLLQSAKLYHGHGELFEFECAACGVGGAFLKRKGVPLRNVVQTVLLDQMVRTGMRWHNIQSLQWAVQKDWTNLTGTKKPRDWATSTSTTILKNKETFKRVGGKGVTLLNIAKHYPEYSHMHFQDATSDVFEQPPGMFKTVQADISGTRATEPPPKRARHQTHPSESENDNTAPSKADKGSGSDSTASPGGADSGSNEDDIWQPDAPKASKAARPRALRAKTITKPPPKRVKRPTAAVAEPESTGSESNTDTDDSSSDSDPNDTRRPKARTQKSKVKSKTSDSPARTKPPSPVVDNAEHAAELEALRAELREDLPLKRRTTSGLRRVDEVAEAERAAEVKAQQARQARPGERPKKQRQKLQDSAQGAALPGGLEFDEEEDSAQTKARRLLETRRRKAQAMRQSSSVQSTPKSVAPAPVKLPETELKPTMDQIEVELKGLLEGQDQKRPAVILRHLQHVAKFDLTFALLKDTALGRHVYGLCNHDDPQVNQYSRACVARWKEVVRTYSVNVWKLKHR